MKTIKEIADHFGVTVGTIGNWRKSVPLDKVNGKYEGLKEWKEAVDLLYERPPNRNDTQGATVLASEEDEEDIDDDTLDLDTVSEEYARERWREKKAKRQLAEIIVAEREGKLINYDEVVLTMSEFAETLKAQLQKLDRGLAKSVVGVTEVEAQERIRKAIGGVLDDLSKGAWLGQKKNLHAYRMLLETALDLSLIVDRGDGQSVTA